LHFHGQGIGLAAFLVDVERAKTYPNPKLAGVELKPGMTATVDIRTGHRSVLKYLAKPVYRAFGGAMNER
jgi:adhesin transport system membrane fusion protein